MIPHPEEHRENPTTPAFADQDPFRDTRQLSLSPVAARIVSPTGPAGTERLPGQPSESPHDAGPERLLTADEVAAILGVPRTLVYALVRNGEMPAVRVGERYIRFRSAALARWIESRESSNPKGSR